jgi:hypothetical protein
VLKPGNMSCRLQALAAWIQSRQADGSWEIRCSPGDAASGPHGRAVPLPRRAD